MVIIPINAGALEITVNRGEAVAGETVVIEVRMTEEVTTKTGSIELVYDHDVLSVESYTWHLQGALLQIFDPVTGQGAFACAEPVQVGDLIFSATFRVAEDADYGQQDIDVNMGFINNENPEDDVEVEDVPTDIYVGCGNHNPGEPTCTEPGRCTICGAPVVEALGHSYGPVTVYPPTPQQDGYSERICATCGFADQFDFVEFDGTDVRGTVTSYLMDTNVTVELLQDGQVAYSTVVRGMVVDYTIKNIPEGNYTLRVSKLNHATREYPLTVGEQDVTFDAKICPKGDVTGDGDVTIKDFQRLLRHVNRSNPLTGYALACGNVTNDTYVNIKDFQRLLRHVNRTNPLFAEAIDVTIKVWAPYEDLPEYYSGWLQEMQSRFEAEHPEYSITWVNESMGEGDAGTYVIQDPENAADVYFYANDMQYRLISVGGLMPLTGSYADQVRNDNIQLAVDSVTHIDEKIYGFPVESNTWFLYYDKQVFTEEDVTNLDVMLQKGRVALPFDNAWTAGAFFLGCGGTIFGENGRDAYAGIDFSGANGGYMAARKMVELAAHPHTEIGALSSYMLINGEVDAVFGGSWNAVELWAALGDNLGVAMLPKFTIGGDEYQMTAMGGSFCVGVNPNAGSQDGKLEACMEFAAFLASEEAQLERYEEYGAIPTHVNLVENELIQADPVAMAQINTMWYAAVLQPGIPEMNNFWSPMEVFARNVWNGSINLNNYLEMVDELSEAFNSYW